MSCYCTGAYMPQRLLRHGRPWGTVVVPNRDKPHLLPGERSFSRHVNELDNELHGRASYSARHR
jgi:hypothetical protein